MSEYYIVKPTCRHCKQIYEMRNDYFGIEALKDCCPKCLSEYGKTWDVYSDTEQSSERVTE